MPRSYWRTTLRLTGGLLALWFVVTFVFVFFADSLNFSFFGWPFNFWFAAQGALLVYLVIICVYATLMNKLDSEQEGARDE